jgi:hypothetical protein
MTGTGASGCKVEDDDTAATTGMEAVATGAVAIGSGFELADSAAMAGGRD